MKVMILADVPDDLGHALMQHLRDFDTAHPGCHFKIAVNAPDMSLGEMQALLNVNPPFAFHDLRRRQ